MSLSEALPWLGAGLAAFGLAEALRLIVVQWRTIRRGRLKE